MKLLRTIVLYGILGISLFVLWDRVLRSPCSKLIEYDIGEFDERFGLERENFLTHIQNAESTWESLVDKPLFRYVPGSDFKVNLIWSEEQARLYEGNKLEQNLNTAEDSIDSLQTRYSLAVQKYKNAVAQYEKSLASYEKEVTYWNSQGGAPTDIYEKLQNQATLLDTKASEIERLSKQVNSLAEQNNQKIDDYNNGVNEYNSLFTQGYEFDAGNTDGTEINIYTYASSEELETLLIHEFGHVLGIDHVDDEHSVMYYLLNDYNKEGELSEIDIAALEVSCRL